jgi:putative chitinase
VSLVKPANEWERILREAGCWQAVLDRFQWGQVFADTIREDTFSKGEAELPDFLATVLHESAFLASLKENGSYSAARIRQIAAASPTGSRWRSLGARADELEHNEAAFFEACYAGRMGNGPEGSGDGARYPGRALIGVTGKANYEWLGDRVGQDLLVSPQLAEQPHFALEFTIKWWEGKVPDSVLGDIPRERRIVNGGSIGLDEVARLYKRVQEVLA